MQMQSAVRKALGLAVFAAAAASSMPALATVTTTNAGAVTVGSSAAGVLRFRNGAPGMSNLNVTVTCIVTFGGTVASLSHASTPVAGISVTSGTFAAGSSQCTSVSLKNAANGLAVSATNPLSVTITGDTVSGVTPGSLANVQLFQPALGNCTAVSGRVINGTYTNPTGSASGILTLKGPFYIGKAVALGDAYDDYCYSATDIQLTVSSPSSPGSQPSVASP